MKTFILFLSLSAFGFANAQNATDNSIKATIEFYSKAGDAQNVEKLRSVLHSNYRLVWYSGQEDPFIADKDFFLSQFEKKEWGGDKRKVSVETIHVFDEINATAKVVMDGDKAEMRSFFTLIKVGSEWKIVGELVNATFK